MASQKSLPWQLESEAAPSSIAQSAESKKAKASLGNAPIVHPWRRAPPMAIKSSEQDTDSSASPRSPLSVSTASTCASTNSLIRVIPSSGSISSEICLSASLPAGSISSEICFPASQLEDQHLKGESEADTHLAIALMDELEMPSIEETQSPVPSRAACKPFEASKAPFWRADPVEAPSTEKEKWHKLNSRADQLCTQTAVLNFPREGTPLKASKNSWLSQQQTRRGLQSSGTNETLDDQEIGRKMKGILNKLTREKFPKLARQLVSCGIQTSSHLDMLIQEIFEKAIVQHHFIDMYADLCALLQVHFAENFFTAEPETDFKKILLTSCQLYFEKHRAPPASLKTLEGEELAQEELLHRTWMLGNIRFIGALLVRKMLASKVMFAIIGQFLSDPTAEALEFLATLLTVVGPIFDVAEFPNRIMLTVIFEKVQELCKKPETSGRVRCLLQDVLDLRAASWTEQKPKKLEWPSTMEQVAEKFHAETAGADTGPSRRKATHGRCQSGFQGAAAQRWADIDVGEDLALTQSVTHESRQSCFQGGWEEEPTQKSQKMPLVSSGGTGGEPANKSSRQRRRDQRRLERKALVKTQGWLVSSGDPIKDALVDKIKSLQRSGMDEKQAWGAFCESQEGSNRDPARYSVDVLQQFVQDRCSSDFSLAP